MTVQPFERNRNRLENQYVNIRFDPDSGWPRDRLEQALARHRSDHPDEPRILTRAWLFHLLCTHGRIAPEPDDYFADKLEHHDLLISLRSEWSRQEHEREFGRDPAPMPGVAESILDLSHTSPDWRYLLQQGFSGLRPRAGLGNGPFHQAVALVYGGAAVLAERLGEASNNEALKALSERAPQTFHEALQLAYLYHELQEMEGEPVRSMGRFDELYIGFYRRDLRAGRLTRDQAKELLKYFWIKFYAKHQGKAFGKNFLFGPDPNELSYLAFEVYREMGTVDPKLSVRVGTQTSEAFLERVIGCIQSGCTGIVLANDVEQVKMLIANGKSESDARDYLLIGCYEPAVMGKELNCSGAAGINLAKAVELTLLDAEPRSFGHILQRYLDILGSLIASTAERTRRHERLWPRVNPSPFLSGTMSACLESGRDVSAGGAEYNTTGMLFAGLADAVDSLAAVEDLVYRRQVCSLDHLREALESDWTGFEHLRNLALHTCPKWGNNDDRADRLAVEVTTFIGGRVNHEPNARGGVFQAALYGILPTVQRFGRQTGALPDGRHAGEPLSINTGAVETMDADGVTSLINSVTKIDLSQFPNGTVLDIMLHPSAVHGTAGIRAVCALVRSHFRQGGMAIQFNVFDADTLRAAQRDPQRYANLQVRVCGWNDRFINLSPEEQRLFIAKAEAIG